MGTKKKGTMILALLCGIVCALSVFTYANGLQRESERQRAEALSRYGGEQIEVCVATRDISPGEKASSSNTVKQLWLADLLPDRALESLDEVEGKQATSLIVSGEVLSAKRFEGASQSISVPQGLQAVSVQVDNEEAVGGALEGGMRVDVYAVGSTGAKLIDSNVLVVDAGGSATKSKTQVTLAVEPSRVQELISATQKTELYFALPGNAQERDSDE